MDLKGLEDPKFSSPTAMTPLAYEVLKPPWNPQVTDFTILGLSMHRSFVLHRISSFIDWPEWLAASCVHSPNFTFLPQAKPTHVI